MFSEELRTIRLLRGFTIEDMCEYVGVSRLTYGKWERGDTSPKADQIPKIANKLGVPIEKLFEQEISMSDSSLKAHIRMIDSLSDEDKEIVKGVIIALLHKTNAERTQLLGREIQSPERTVHEPKTPYNE